jgi:hypothetical protein
MSKNVIWTQDERTALAAATLNLLSNAAQMPVAGMNSADVQKQAQRYGFFSGVFRQAQRYVFAATPERVRTIITHTQVPWLMEEIYSRMREVHVADMIAAQEKERSAAQAAAAKEKSVLEAVSLTLTASPDGLHKLADELAHLCWRHVQVDSKLLANGAQELGNRSNVAVIPSRSEFGRLERQPLFGKTKTVLALLQVGEIVAVCVA